MSTSFRIPNSLRVSVLSLAAAAVFTVPQNLSAQMAGEAQTASADGAKALQDIFHDYWERTLKRQPEFASSLGDKRYNDQISDYSVKALNEWLSVEQDLLLK